MLNKNFSNCFKPICRGSIDWRGRYLKLTCTREKLEILNHFSEMDFFCRNSTLLQFGKSPQKEEVLLLFFFLLYIRSPIGRAHKNQKTTNHKLWEHRHCCESILNRLTLEITTGEEQHNLVEGVPATGRGFGIRSSLKIPSNLNHSVILQPCSAICVQYHSRPLYFQIILILKRHSSIFSVVSCMKLLIWQTFSFSPAITDALLHFSPYWENNQKNQSISFAAVISPVLFL